MSEVFGISLVVDSFLSLFVLIDEGKRRLSFRPLTRKKRGRGTPQSWAPSREKRAPLWRVAKKKEDKVDLVLPFRASSCSSSSRGRRILGFRTKRNSALKLLPPRLPPSLLSLSGWQIVFPLGETAEETCPCPLSKGFFFFFFSLSFSRICSIW